MLSYKKLRKQLKQYKGGSFVELAKQYAEKITRENSYALWLKEKVTGSALPSCFGILFEKGNKKCVECILNPYCEVAFVREGVKQYITIQEADVNPVVLDNNPFKEGSRAYRLVRRWQRVSFLRINELEALSRELFRSTMNVQYIITVLRHCKLLQIKKVHKTLWYSVKTHGN